MIRDGWDYFLDPFNYFDIVSLVFNAFQVLNHVHRLGWLADWQVNVCAAISIFLMWLKLLYWLRIFSSTSFYIRLIT
jgi:hypothetical protein